MKKYFSFFSFFFLLSTVNAQLTLDADGPGGTYALITSKLAPGYNPVEVPDCGHSSFGAHIDEVFDTDLNTHVFRFHLHTNEDDDRCINFDRQRCEIKTYDKSPDDLLGVEGEEVEYKWKFKLDAGFQSSPKFTHIHQLKAVGGSESSMPLITLTTRSGSPDELELRYAETTTQVTLFETALAPFKGIWCEAIENVTYGENGTYSLVIKRVSDGTELFNFSDNDIRMWKTDADFIRPKWGIYRSLQESDYLRDEEVLFANFSIEEINVFLPVELISFSARIIEEVIQLDWQTASEQNNKGFEIQRSNDGRDWELVAFVAGKGNANITTNYTFKDDSDFIGKRYYQLKQIDEDGRFQFSDTVVIAHSPIIDVHVFPNPTNGIVEIYGLDQDYFVEIFDAAGNKVLEQDSNDDQLDLSTFEKGIYVLKIAVGENIIVRKIIR